MTQYLLAVRRDYAVPAAPELTRQRWHGVVGLIDKMTDAGAFVFQGGLIPPETATVVRQSGSGFLVTDGPYAETKEHLGGFFVINAAGVAAALEWAKLAAVAQRRTVEVRQFFDGDLDEAIRGLARQAERGPVGPAGNEPSAGP